MYCLAAGDFVCVHSLPDHNDRGLWSGNETSCAHAYKIRKWHPKQRSECCEWLLLTFEAMKTLSGRRVPRCDKHQFRAKMTVST